MEWQEASGRNRTVGFGLQRNVQSQTSPNTKNCRTPRSSAPSIVLRSGGCNFLASQSRALSAVGSGRTTGCRSCPPCAKQCPRSGRPIPHGAERQEVRAEAVLAGLGCPLLPHRPQGTRLWGGRAPGQGGANGRASVGPMPWRVPSVTAWELACTAGTSRTSSSSVTNLFSKSIIFIYLGKICTWEMKKFAERM